jgi:hypothetical protein
MSAGLLRVFLRFIRFMGGGLRCRRRVFYAHYAEAGELCYRQLLPKQQASALNPAVSE